MRSHRVVQFLRPSLLGAAALSMVVLVACRPDTIDLSVSTPAADQPAAAGLQARHLDPLAGPTRAAPKKPNRTKPRTNGPSAVRAGGAPPALGVQFHGMWAMYWTGPGGLTPTAMFTRHLDQLAAHRVSVLRVDLGWSGSQPTSAAPSASSNYNRKFATVLKAAQARGMKVLVTVHQSPAWTRPGTGSNVKQLPRDAEAIRPWMQFMARTYGSRVLAWEIWNEPNLEAFTGVADAHERAVRYVPVLKAAATGLRAGQRNALVVFGGPAQTDDAFIADAYELGAKPYFDVMAFHPYQGNQTSPPETADTSNARWRITHLPAVVRVMAANGDARKPIWWTEFGVSTHSNEGVSQVWRLGVPDATVSGDYLRRSFELARERWPQVRLGIVYTAYKTPSDSWGHQYGYRLLEPDGRVRAQLPILRDYLNQFSGTRPLY